MFGAGHPVTDHYWLAAHDGHNHKPLLPKVTLRYGLAGGLIAEMIMGGHATIARDPAKPDDTSAYLWLVRGATAPRDTALEQAYARLAQGRSEPAGEAQESQAPEDPFPGPSAQGWWPNTGPADQRQPGHSFWNARTSTSPYTADHSRHAANIDFGRRSSAYGTQTYGTSGAASQWWTSNAPDPGTRQAVRDFLDVLAHDQGAESLVINRLMVTGMVRVEERRRILGGFNRVILPRDSVVSGRALSWTRSALRDNGSRPSGTEAWRLEPEVLMLAGLFLATGVYDLPDLRLEPLASERLTTQLKNDLDPRLRRLLFHVEDAANSRAINR